MLYIIDNLHSKVTSFNTSEVILHVVQINIVTVLTLMVSIFEIFY